MRRLALLLATVAVMTAGVAVVFGEATRCPPRSRKFGPPSPGSTPWTRQSPPAMSRPVPVRRRRLVRWASIS